MNLYKAFLNSTILISFSSILIAQLAFAESLKPITGETVLDISPNKDTKIQLEVRQMPLAKVLESISIKNQVPIHYSVLPMGLVTATCVGSSLKQVLECLLDKKADIIVRYLNESKNDPDNGQVVEVWILGSRIGDSIAKDDCSSTNLKDTGFLGYQNNDHNIETDQTNDFIKAAQSKDPQERADAIGALLSSGQPDDPAIRAILEEALTDKNDNVRAQAISSLAHREGKGAKLAIQTAMDDKSVDVRMMAVDAISDDISLLQQAINDKDETIRALATLKLEQLNQANASIPKK